jgi:hypothetical protein
VSPRLASCACGVSLPLADLRDRARASFQRCAEFPPQSSLQAPQQAEVAALRRDVEDCHKACCARALASLLACSRPSLHSTCSSCQPRSLRWQPPRASWCACRTRRLARSADASQVSGYIRSLDRDLGSFADELVIQAREAEAEALEAQAQRESGPPVSQVRVLRASLRLARR